jgi:hypothetical protein
MSLGIVFKGPEGIVLAVDSRVTLNVEMTQPNGTKLILPSTFDNATKLLSVNGQDYVGVITFGLGALGRKEPRTAHSFIPEFEAELKEKLEAEPKEKQRLSVEDFANTLATFFMGQWAALGMPDPATYKDDPMAFVVAGYNEGEAYGRVYQFLIPHHPRAVEQIGDEFGSIWGGQTEFVDRIVQGYDQRLIPLVAHGYQQNAQQIAQFEQELKQLSIQIPYQFLPLQDCVDLSIFLIRATINLQQWTIGLRGVGGAIDVATITRTNGFQAIQQKHITGE